MSKTRKIFLFVALPLVIIFTGLTISQLRKSVSSGAHQPAATQNQNTAAAQNNPAGPPLKLKSIGFNLGYYDPATNKAGDMVFTKEDNELSSNFHLIFADFGVHDPRTADLTKTNPQPVFILPLGTKVHSLVDGVVINVETLYSGDYTVMVAENAGSNWIYETEHINSPLVKKGDRVTGGQIIGEVSTHGSDTHPGFGIVEIGILHGGNPPTHVCPFAYLDDSIKADTQAKITAIHLAWEKYLGNSALYDDEHTASPGCFTLTPANG